MEIFNPEFIASTCTGGAAVWVATKIHVHYICEKLKHLEVSVEKVNDRLTLHTSDHKVHHEHTTKRS